MTEKTKVSRVIGTPLYQLSAEYGKLLDRLETLAEENGGVIPDPAVAEFERLEGDVHVKLENCAIVMHAMAHDVELTDAELKRLRARKQATQNALDRMKRYVGRCMEVIGVKKSDGVRGIAKVRLQKSRAAVEVVDANDVPAEFCTVTVTLPQTQWESIVHDLDSSTETIGDDYEVQKVERKVDKTAVYDFWKQTGKAPAGTKVEQAESLRVS